MGSAKVGIPRKRQKNRVFRRIDTGQVFRSAREAAKAVGVCKSWFLELFDRGCKVIGNVEFEELKGVLFRIPECLHTPEFVEAFSLWAIHRKEIKKKLTKTAAQMQIKRLEKMGLEKALAAIEHSIANGYQGIWEAPEPKVMAEAKHQPILRSEGGKQVGEQVEDLSPEQRVANVRRIREMAKQLARQKEI